MGLMAAWMGYYNLLNPGCDMVKSPTLLKSLHIIVLGQPRVKKNSQKVYFNPSTKRSYKVNTAAYNKWHKSALEQLDETGFNTTFKEQKKWQPELKAMFQYPINLQCRFYMSTNGVVDLSALYEGIQDVLVEVGILEDDNWHIVASHDGSGVAKDAARPRMEITITPKED